jgi:hypothetical protein
MHVCMRIRIIISMTISIRISKLIENGHTGELWNVFKQIFDEV